jgi:hypothetical protein
MDEHYSLTAVESARDAFLTTILAATTVGVFCIAAYRVCGIAIIDCAGRLVLLNLSQRALGW